MFALKQALKSLIVKPELLLVSQRQVGAGRGHAQIRGLGLIRPHVAHREAQQRGLAVVEDVVGVTHLARALDQLERVARQGDEVVALQDARVRGGGLARSRGPAARAAPGEGPPEALAIRRAVLRGYRNLLFVVGRCLCRLCRGRLWRRLGAVFSSRCFIPATIVQDGLYVCALFTDDGNDIVDLEAMDSVTDEV